MGKLQLQRRVTQFDAVDLFEPSSGDIGHVLGWDGILHHLRFPCPEGPCLFQHLAQMRFKILGGFLVNLRQLDIALSTVLLCKFLGRFFFLF